MINWRMMKIFASALFVNLFEDIALLAILGAKIDKYSLIGAFVFASIVTFIIEKFIIKGEN